MEAQGEGSAAGAREAGGAVRTAVEREELHGGMMTYVRWFERKSLEENTNPSRKVTNGKQ